jgi:hypothetical protein
MRRCLRRLRRLTAADDCRCAASSLLVDLLRLADLFHDHDALSAVAHASKHGDSSGEEGGGEGGAGAGAEGAAGHGALKYAKRAARPVLDMLPRVPPMLVITLLRMLQARSHFLFALDRPLPFPLFVAYVVKCRAVPPSHHARLGCNARGGDEAGGAQAGVAE